MNTQASTTLYGKILSAPEKITWKDIFATGQKKHDQSDVDYALIAGTTLDTVKTEIGMLQKWQQPWLYRRVLMTGLILTAVLLAAVFVVIEVYGVCVYPALNLLVLVVPPCVVPVSLMVFFWEMNAPRDISLFQLLGYFFSGGVLSLTITIVLLNVMPLEGGAELAPFTEEPAKLLAALVFLKMLHRKNGAVYGFSGLALGAAVGAGFGAFESAQYAFDCLPTVDVAVNGLVYALPVMQLDTAGLMNVLSNIALRSICAVCGHVLYCAPYACLAALNMNGSGNAARALCSLPFWTAFAVSFIGHALWNSMGLLLLIPLTVVLWTSVLYGVRKSFAQLTEKVNLANGASTATTPYKIQGVTGVHAGVAFAITKSEILIGSDSSCQLNYPVSLSDIAKIHGKLLIRQGNMYLADLGSQSGTYLNGMKLKPMTGYLLKPGDRFVIGTSGQEFQIM